MKNALLLLLLLIAAARPAAPAQVDTTGGRYLLDATGRTGGSFRPTPRELAVPRDGLPAGPSPGPDLTPFRAPPFFVRSAPNSQLFAGTRFL